MGAGWIEVVEAGSASISTRRAIGPDAGEAVENATDDSRRRRFGAGSSTGDCGGWRRRMGLSVPALVSARTNGCESGTTLGGVPQESDCVRLMGRLLVKGGVAAEGAVCGLFCGEERRTGEVRAHRLGLACLWCSWPDAG